jgi:hypothetical protein
MDPRHKASVLWGVVGGLAFLVLVQGYELVAGAGVTVLAKAGVGLAVAAIVTVAAHALRPRLRGNERS